MLANRHADRINLALNYLVVLLAFLLPVWRRWVSVVAPLVIVLWLFDGPLKEKVAALKKQWLVIAVLLFILLNLLSLLWSQDVAEGFDYLAKYRYLLLIPVIAGSLRPRFRELAVAAFLLALALSLLWSFGLCLELLDFGNGTRRNPAPTMLHLDYSMFLAFGALLVLNRVLTRPMAMNRRLLWLLFCVFLCAGLFVNIGRSGQLAFFGTLLVVLPSMLRIRAVLRVVVAATTVVVILVGAYLVAPTFKKRVDSATGEVRGAIVDGNYETNQGKRIAGMIVSLEIFRQHPIIGTGVADNMTEFRRLLRTRFQGLRKAVSWFPHLHNQYLQIATELGLVGILVFLNIFLQLFRTKNSDREMHNLRIILGCVFLFGFIGDPFFHKQLPLILFSLMAGLIAAEQGSLWWTREASPEESSS